MKGLVFREFLGVDDGGKMFGGFKREFINSVEIYFYEKSFDNRFRW